jgi:hypothetical protein
LHILYNLRSENGRKAPKIATKLTCLSQIVIVIFLKTIKLIFELLGLYQFTLPLLCFYHLVTVSVSSMKQHSAVLSVPIHRSSVALCALESDQQAFYVTSVCVAMEEKQFRPNTSFPPQVDALTGLLICLTTPVAQRQSLQ